MTMSYIMYIPNIFTLLSNIKRAILDNFEKMRRFYTNLDTVYSSFYLKD